MSPPDAEAKKGQRIMVDNIRVDVPALMSIRHRCRPEICRDTKHCCSCFQIHVDEKELETIVGFLPLVQRYKPSISDDKGYANVFEEAEEGCFIIDADEDDQCVFAYKTAARETLCALHSAAIDLGLQPVDVKPKCCSLWPLALSAGPSPVLSVNARFAAFPCNQRREAANDIDDGIKEAIRIYFGESFLAELLSKAGG